ncbi:hypothetical protein [Nocardiopsis salina]|uniref:hypothetical protein n=1 Tax=Nocardiopsis salina TaxID=245836 RepID=UPI00034492C4|nr:hypothetical protein [Nocardiopsis salina]
MTETRDRDEQVEGGAGVPWTGLGATAVALVAMAALATTAWPDLPAAVDNDESGVGPHGGTMSRGLLVAVMPLTLVGLGVLLLGLSAVGHVLRPHLPAALRGSSRGTRAAGDAVMVSTALLLAPLHGVVVLNAAGGDLPVAFVAGLSVGSGLVLLGLLLPRVQRLRNPEDGIGLILARNARPTGAAVAGVGAVQIVMVFFTDDVLVASLPPLLLVPAMVGAFVWPFLRYGLRTRADERAHRG